MRVIQEIVLGKTILLLVEGNDDYLLISKMLQAVEGSEKVLCVNAGSKDKFQSKLQMLTFESEFSQIQKIAIISDADFNPEQSRLNIEKYFRKANLPEHIDTSVLLVPSDKNGMLEDVCMDSKSDELVMNCVNSFISCIEPHVEELPRNPSKSRFLAYMATKPKATNGTIEAALQKGYFDLNHSAFDEIRAFLTELCQ